MTSCSGREATVTSPHLREIGKAEGQREAEREG